MRFGIVGLGRMGANMALAALEHGHEVVGHDRGEDVMTELAAEGVQPAATAQELVARLDAPRVVFI